MENIENMQVEKREDVWLITFKVGGRRARLDEVFSSEADALRAKDAVEREATSTSRITFQRRVQS